MKSFPFAFWKGSSIDPTTLPGFTAMWRQPDYVKTSSGLWVPRATTLAPSNPANFQTVNPVNQPAPTDANGEPTFASQNVGVRTFLATGGTLDQFVTQKSWTVYVGFKSTKSQAPAGAAYDDPQIFANGGGYWGIAYSNRVEAWFYPGATPGIPLALAVDTWAVATYRYDNSHAAATKLQARLGKGAWTSFGSDPGAVGNLAQILAAGTTYNYFTPATGQFEGTIRFGLTYNLPHSDADADSVFDWAHATWPSSF